MSRPQRALEFYAHVGHLRNAGLAGPALGHALDEKRIKTIREYKREFIEQWRQ